MLVRAGRDVEARVRALFPRMEHPKAVAKEGHAAAVAIAVAIAAAVAEQRAQPRARRSNPSLAGGAAPLVTAALPSIALPPLRRLESVTLMHLPEGLAQGVSFTVDLVHRQAAPPPPAAHAAAGGSDSSAHPLLMRHRTHTEARTAD